MTTNTNAAIAEDLQDMVSKALRRAWQLGQTYWQQADSEYTSQHRKADETQGKFDALVEETRTALSTAAQPPAGWRMVPVEPTIGMCIAGDEARITPEITRRRRRSPLIDLLGATTEKNNAD